MSTERARPSLLSSVSTASTSITLNILSLQSLKETDKEKFEILKAIEKIVQDEMDEQLRILNEKGIKERTIRDMIIKVRDESYDAIHYDDSDGTDKLVFEDQTEKE